MLHLAVLKGMHDTRSHSSFGSAYRNARHEESCFIWQCFKGMHDMRSHASFGSA